MSHHLEKREATVAHWAKLVPLWSRPVRCNNKVAFAPNLDALLEVSLVGEHFLQPADIA